MMGRLRVATDIFVGDWKLNASKSRFIDEMRVEGLDERTLEIIDKVNGKVTRTERRELSPDLKTLTRTVRPVGQRDPNIFVFERQ